ncbi:MULTISPECIES: alpha-ribazole phosphatase [unclassified Candidatus Frackibacter]|uniref:alpha-ribazole phosphatase n=1 Tax=unclassified Candidatus Frackibacter TaxID=2648818 RepID=UPI00089159C8|nr:MULTISPECIES: alpha-ribazole phosphatase [unclassified Candidatus Frackibacter]SDC33610.1 phosphoglycerate mutase [Candidatus Frackibacter sp. WG11]SEM57539.1 phosphoglycerate mutase [Candidatus Frackibacter sp. WG12]SFL69739.1 phosphoglycerate mutase [Candidatus Frackibacter sp. WG13]
MATEIILVRHGETLWNKESRFQGSTDIELSSLGKEQAKKLAERFRDIEIDMIYASNLQRAFETAERVADYHNIKVKQISKLQEASFGDWEGLTFNQIKEEDEDRLDAWLKDPVTVRTPGGEKFEDVQKRAKEALNDIKAEHQDSKVLVVAHGGTIRALLTDLLGMPLSNFWRIQQDNTAVNIVKVYDGDPIVALVNCTKHL